MCGLVDYLLRLYLVGVDSATKTRSLPRHVTAEMKDQVAYSSADEEYTKRGGGSKVSSRAARLRSRDEKKPHSGNRKLMEYLPTASGGKSRPARLALQHSVNDPTLSRSHDSLVGVTPTSRRGEKKSQFLPDVVKSSARTSKRCNSEWPSALHHSVGFLPAFVVVARNMH